MTIVWLIRRARRAYGGAQITLRSELIGWHDVELWTATATATVHLTVIGYATGATARIALLNLIALRIHEPPRTIGLP